MFKFIHYNQIRKSIVSFNSVFMMHDFIFTKWTFKFLLHFKAMLKNIASFISGRMIGFIKPNISPLYSFSISMQIGTFMRTIFGNFNPIRITYKKFFPATNAKFIKIQIVQSFCSLFSPKFFKPSASARWRTKKGSFGAIRMHEKSFFTDNTILNDFYQFWSFHKGRNLEV